MSRSNRRYTVGAKRRRLDRGREAPFWVSEETDLSYGPDNGVEERSPLTRYRNLSRKRSNEVESKLTPKHRLRHVAKRQEGEDGRNEDGEGGIIPEIINEVVENAQTPGVTVTVSIGIDIQVTTLSVSGSTFISLSTTMFTLDSTGGISSLPTPTVPLPITPEVSIPIQTTPPGAPTNNATSQTPITTTAPVAEPLTPDPSLPQEDVATAPITTISSLQGSNMTDYRRIVTTTKDRTVIIYPEISTESPDETQTGTNTRRTGSSVSTAIVSTIVPVNGDPTSPASPTINADSEFGGTTETSTSTSVPVSERLPPILGGVFGGLAGIGLVLWALLYLLRKRRRNPRGGAAFAITGAGAGMHQRTFSDDTAPESYGTMSQTRSSNRYNFFTRHSVETEPPPPSERGFQKISGRKLPSLYGDDMIPASMMVAHARASASDPGSRNVSGGTYPIIGGSYNQDDDIFANPVSSPFSSSPARTAMRTGSPGLASRIPEHEPEDDLLIHTSPQQTPFGDHAESSTRFPTPPPGAIRRMQSLIGADGVGRSLASQDGSKTSRFTEDV